MSIAPPESDQTEQARSRARADYWHKVFQNPCPYCGSPAGVRCRNLASRDTWAQFPHSARCWLLSNSGEPMPRYMLKRRPPVVPPPPIKLSDSDYAIVLFIHTHRAQHYRTPSYAEIGAARGITEAEAYRRIEALARMGVPLL